MSKHLQQKNVHTITHAHVLGHSSHKIRFQISYCVYKYVFNSASPKVGAAIQVYNICFT
jgi:hypothetical protein